MVAPLALVLKWPPDCATCISSKFGHQMAPLVLLSKLTTRLHYLYCYIALLALSVSIELVSSSARVASDEKKKWNSHFRIFFDPETTFTSEKVRNHFIFHLIIFRSISSLSDPGKPGVLSLGPDVRPSVRHRGFWNFTELTLADEDTNSILTDNASRAIQGNVAMQGTQVVPSGDQICN